MGYFTLSIFLNNTIDVHNELSNLSAFSINIKNIENIDQTINELNIQKEKINSIKFQNINRYLKKYNKEEKKAIIKIYNSSIIIKKKNGVLKMKREVLNQIDNNLEFLNFLKDNKDNYFLKGNLIVSKNEDFLTRSKQYKINFIIISEDIYNYKKIPVLMYHAVDDITFGQAGLFVKVSDFESQMKYLHDNGYTTLFISEIEEAVKYEKPVIITFDDGYMNVYTKAYPIMKKYNIKSTVYIIADWLGGKTFVTSEIVKEMDASGLVEMGSHSLSHVNLGSNSYINQEKELKESKKALETLLNKKITAIAYPYGSYNNDTINIAKNTYLSGVTVESGFNFLKTLDMYKIKRHRIVRNESMKSFIYKIGG